MQPSSRHDPPGRGRAGLALALTVLLTAESGGAARASAQAASPFPEVVVVETKPPSYLWANAMLASGAVLVAGSFPLRKSADDAYDEYLVETDPGRIESSYDRAVRYDRLSSAALISGEVFLVAGLYFRFLHRPRDSRVSLGFQPGRCALSLRF